MDTFESFDGVRIAYQQWQADVAGPPALLHHGFAADTAANWVATGIVDALVAAGRRVVAIDARGHGRSDKPHEPASYDSPAMARDVHRLIDHLDLDRVDLIGYSMGGYVSLEVATSEPRLRSLVVGGIGAGALPGNEATGSGIDRGRIADAMEADDPTGADPQSAAFRMLADVTGADRLALAAVLWSDNHRSGDVTAISCPTLVLAGVDDPLATGADRLAAAIPGAEFTPVPGDHLSAVVAPELVAAIVGFLGRLDARV